MPAIKGDENEVPFEIPIAPSGVTKTVCTPWHIRRVLFYHRP